MVYPRMMGGMDRVGGSTVAPKRIIAFANRGTTGQRREEGDPANHKGTLTSRRHIRRQTEPPSSPPPPRLSSGPVIFRRTPYAPQKAQRSTSPWQSRNQHALYIQPSASKAGRSRLLHLRTEAPPIVGVLEALQRQRRVGEGWRVARVSGPTGVVLLLLCRSCMGTPITSPRDALQRLPLACIGARNLPHSLLA